MQRGHRLHFDCIQCKTPLFFSVLSPSLPLIACSKCQKRYALDHPSLLRKLRKFEALCRQIHESEEILGDTAVAIDAGPHHVKVPYRLLLTRLSSVLALKMEDHKVEIAFRLEPLQDVPEVLSQQ